MLRVVHKSCGGLAVENTIFQFPDYPQNFFDETEEIRIHCLTCLEEIIDRSELVITEEIGQ